MAKEKKEVNEKKEFKNIGEVLNHIQINLNAPKNQFNKFGKYNYRNTEDILMALKPLLKETGAYLTITDEIIEVGNRIYVKAIATLYFGDMSISTSALARESESKKGMDDSQVTGSTSSYARKYALNGLFAIDDNKDPDNNDNSKSGEKILNDRQISEMLYKAGNKEQQAKFLKLFKQNGKLDEKTVAELYKGCDSDTDEFFRIMQDMQEN